MHYPTYLNVALDFAQKFNASHVTIETDEGTFDMIPNDARNQFDDLAPGETFVLLAIHFSTDN